MDVFFKMIYNVITSRLIIYIIIKISHTPKDSGITDILCNLKGAFAVFSFRRPEKTIHFVSGRFFHVICIICNFFTNFSRIRFWHTNMMGSVISDNMPLFFHSFDQFRLILNIMAAQEESPRCFMLL